MSTAQIFSFFRRPAPSDWSPQDIAEFYRVESVLTQAGLRVTSARGLSDEGDPWFVFCRAEDEEVVIHFARIDGRYVISAPAYCGNAEGLDFRSLVRGMIEDHPMVQLRPRGDNVFLHPTTLLVVMVATALLKLGPAAEAASARQDTADAAAGKLQPRGVGVPATPGAGLAPPDAQQGTLILAAVNGALAMTVLAEPATIVVSASAYATDAAGPPQVTFSDTSPWETPNGTADVGAGSVTPLAPRAEPAVAVVLASVAHPSLNGAALPPPDAALSAAAGTAPLAGPADWPSVPPHPAVAAAAAATDPMAGATQAPLSGLARIPQADKALLITLGLPDTVAYVSTLPAVFSSVVQTGTHTGVHTAAVEASPVAARSATAPEASHATAPAAPEAAQGSAAAVPAMSAVIATVEQFQAGEIRPVVVVTDHAAIFYDAYAVDTALGAVKSVTYDFGDGFSISLVGLPAELAHAGVHV